MLVYLKTTKSVKCYAMNYKYLERIINLIKLIKIYKSYYLVIQEATVLIRARSCSGPKKLLCSNLCKIVRCTYTTNHYYYLYPILLSTWLQTKYVQQATVSIFWMNFGWIYSIMRSSVFWFQLKLMSRRGVMSIWKS